MSHQIEERLWPKAWSTNWDDTCQKMCTL